MFKNCDRSQIIIIIIISLQKYNHTKVVYCQQHSRLQNIRYNKQTSHTAEQLRFIHTYHNKNKIKGTHH